MLFRVNRTLLISNSMQIHVKILSKPKSAQMLEKLERQNAFLSRPCSLKEHKNKIVFFSFKNFSVCFTITRFKPPLIGSKYAMFLWSKTYVSVFRKKLSRTFSAALSSSLAPLPLLLNTLEQICNMIGQEGWQIYVMVSGREGYGLENYYLGTLYSVHSDVWFQNLYERPTRKTCEGRGALNDTHTAVANP